MSGRITNPMDIRRFVTGGHAVFTLVSKRTGKRYTFQINKPTGKPFFARYLTDSNNEGDYTYLGYMTEDDVENHILSLRPGKRGNPTSLPFRGLNWFLSHMDCTDRFEFWHEGSCGRCGRRLTVPESIATGLGPVCATR